MRFARLARAAAWLRTSRAGSASVDAALGLPILLMFLFGITEISRGMWIQTNVQQAVEAAARCAAINTTTCDTAANIKTYAAGQIHAYTVASSNFSYATPACGKEVSATVPFQSAVTGIVGIEVNLTAKSCYPA
jgi:Flp pilus assembly protein TadG